MEGRAEKQNRKNVEQVQLKGWPGSQLVSWPGMFHPNPCGRLINNMNRCSGCNSVGKISTRDRARESIHLLIPCPVLWVNTAVVLLEVGDVCGDICSDVVSFVRNDRTGWM